MNTKLNEFQQKIPDDVFSFIQQLVALGAKVGLVGGVTRDFLLNGTLSKDIDIELRHSDADFIKMISSRFKGRFNEQFQIASFIIGEYSLEIGAPRIESFLFADHHKNFTFKKTLDYDDAFKRRDFTINAIMFELSQDGWQLYDPLKGIEHIQKKQLHPCSEFFDKDPVRVLRAIRFKINLNFTLSFGLHFRSEYPCSYLLSEANKCIAPLSFFFELGLINKDPKLSAFNNHSRKLGKQISYDLSLGDQRAPLLDALGLSKRNILTDFSVQKAKQIALTCVEQNYLKSITYD